MKVLKKTLLIVLFLALTTIVGGFIFVNISLPKLPKLTNHIIEKTLKKGTKKLKGEQGYAVNDSVKIWYESLATSDTARGDIILIMGIANDALAWPEYFTQELIDSGYRVIRYDHRGTGLSDWIDDWDKDNAYDLNDMAADVIAILDTLNITKAHIVGASLGGMIGQTIAINYPERVITLTSMMSTGDMMDKNLPPINPETVSKLMVTQLRYGFFESEENTIKIYIMSKLILSDDTCSEEDIEGIANAVTYNLRERKGYNKNASRQHTRAVMLSKSRYNDLSKLNIPVLIIHGKNDPLINFSHGKKCYETIPGADTLWIENMGHDINRKNSVTIVNKIVDLIDKSTNE